MQNQLERIDLVRMIGHSANCLKNKVIILPKEAIKKMVCCNY